MSPVVAELIQSCKISAQKRQSVPEVRNVQLKLERFGNGGCGPERAESFRNSQGANRLKDYTCGTLPATSHALPLFIPLFWTRSLWRPWRRDVPVEYFICKYASKHCGVSTKDSIISIRVKVWRCFLTDINQRPGSAGGVKVLCINVWIFYKFLSFSVGRALSQILLQTMDVFYLHRPTTSALFY